MNPRFALCAALLALAMTTTACGENQFAAPAEPTPPSLSPLFLPPLPAVDGLWGGAFVLESIAGGTGPTRDAGLIEPCIQAAFGAVLGTERAISDHSLSLTETETGLEARLTSGGAAPSFLGTGLACSYKGRVGDSTLALDASTCDASALSLRCQLPDGTVQVHGLEIIGSSITATYSRPAAVPPARQPGATAISGRAAHTYLVDGGASGSFVANHRFDLTRR